ncbi:MAG: hypothetical protein IH862_11220 [Chloroflexi bacterium]|nr:hypothetical protein [Chloroflexota bacterium]
MVLEFVIGHRTIARDWDQLHTDFTTWREGLIACDASSVKVALRQFAARFIGIAEAARGLPRHPVARDLADKVSTAVEKEEQAVRQLRDNWQPETPEVFENVDMERSTSSALRIEVEDNLSDLQVGVSLSSRAQVGAFSQALQQLTSDWDEFHRRYDSFRAEEPRLSSSETARRLSQLVEEFSNVVIAVRQLPTSEPTRQVSQILAQAAEEEELALRKLRGSFGEAAPESVQQATDDLSDQPSAPQEEATSAPHDITLFDALDGQLVRSNALIRHAIQELADVFSNTSEDSEAALAGFASQYRSLSQEWDDFHKDYDDWRMSEGGCDRSKSIAVLGQFTLRFGELAGEVRALPRAAFLRPLGELLVEAVEREQKTLIELRNTWRPFDSEVYENLEQKRNEARRLRRQVTAGIQDLLARYDISAPELEGGQ